MTDMEAIGPQATAAVAMIGRTGAKEFMIRYSDEEKPVVWVAQASFTTDRTGRPMAGKHGQTRYEVAAGLVPEEAIYRLLDQLLDGGECQHCHRATGAAHDLDAMPLSEAVCWYQYDPERKTYRRGCEGETG